VPALLGNAAARISAVPSRLKSLFDPCPHSSKLRYPGRHASRPTPPPPFFFHSRHSSASHRRRSRFRRAIPTPGAGQKCQRRPTTDADAYDGWTEFTVKQNADGKKKTLFSAGGKKKQIVFVCFLPLRIEPGGAWDPGPHEERRRWLRGAVSPRGGQIRTLGRCVHGQPKRLVRSRRPAITDLDIKQEPRSASRPVHFSRRLDSASGLTRVWIVASTHHQGI